MTMIMLSSATQKMARISAMKMMRNCSFVVGTISSDEAVECGYSSVLANSGGFSWFSDSLIHLGRSCRWLGVHGSTDQVNLR